MTFKAKNLTFNAKDLSSKAKDLTSKAKDLAFKAKDLKIVLKNSLRLRTPITDNIHKIMVQHGKASMNTSDCNNTTKYLARYGDKGVTCFFK